MAKEKSGPSKNNIMRRQAEKQLAGKEANLQEKPKATAEDLEKLVRELRVYQIQLEMQSEALLEAQTAIEEQRSKYNDLYDFSPLAYFTFDRKGRIVDVNLSGAGMLGVERIYLKNSLFLFFIEPKSRALFNDHCRKIFSTGIRESCELKLVKKDATPIYALVESIGIRDRDGNISQCRSAISDITERKKAEEALKAEHALCGTMENSLMHGIIMFDSKYRITRVNPAFCKMVGWGKEELLGLRPPFVFWPRGEVKNIAKAFFQIVHSKESTGILQHPLQQRNGGRFEALVLLSPMKDDMDIKVGWIASVTDITEFKQIDTALRESEKKRRFLTSELLKAEENCRKRLAHELRTSLRESLITIKSQSESLLHRAHEAGDESITETLKSLVNNIQSTMEVAKRIERDLRPSILDDEGVIAAINWLCRQFQATFQDIRVESEIESQEEEIPDLLKSAIFRISQEAMDNIAKHSKANLVHVSLRKELNTVELIIQDNGCGFDLNEAFSMEIPKAGLGLISMKERAELAGGCFNIESIQTRGTSILVSWAL